jgi:hypothetical protein
LLRPRGDLGIDVAEPTFGEVVMTIKGLNDKKAPGANEVITKLFKFATKVGLMFVHECILKTWCLRKMPKDWK